MLDFIDAKPFGAVVVGAVTLATGYHSGVDTWALLALPLSVMTGYYFAFHSKPH